MTIPEAEIRAELERILASKGLATAGRLSRLLRYVVDKTIAGQSDELKEYAVGVEVFDRDANYDPRLDSIVRVEAGRLRSRLDEYYNGEGASSAIRINLPRGGYIAQFEMIDKPKGLSPPVPDLAPVPELSGGDGPSGPSITGRQRVAFAAWPLTAGLICAVAAMVVWLGGWNRTPAQADNADVAVLPFSSAAEDSQLAARLTETVTTELARLKTVDVASHTSAVGIARGRSLREIASDLNVSFVVEASIERDSGGVLVVTRLVNAETDRKVWVADYRGGPDEVRTIAHRMALDVSSELSKRLSR